jgi:hypothetical protein
MTGFWGRRDCLKTAIAGFVPAAANNFAHMMATMQSRPDLAPRCQRGRHLVDDLDQNDACLALHKSIGWTMCSRSNRS